ncbi:hypothetical protein LOK49_LG04G00440 [Camellia lanceoleosa]|uniref:Uncharacterized protein n=1 Tax=Camellia lanceoleosa TaxID=1840588 RepID=A0ACC0I1V1_9ERIC|nr:hypothetical protein LOK49_LG04G00440 [Camellia lanceoleosa]
MKAVPIHRKMTVFIFEADMVSDLDMWTHSVPSRGLETNAFEAKTGCAKIISDLDMWTHSVTPFFIVDSCILLYQILILRDTLTC